MRALPWEIVRYVVLAPGGGGEDKPGGWAGSEADADADGSSYDASLEGPAFVSGSTPIDHLRSGFVWD